VVLATQNPVDLDYKGLSNMGTWFIGRLQTERDKERLIDGLLGGTGTPAFSKSELLKLISGLKKRQFLMQNVHEKQPQVFQTRWVMSYLRGPLTRDQIKLLMQDRVAAFQASAPQAAPAAATQQTAAAGSRPQLPPEFRQYFAQPTRWGKDGDLVYHPYLVAGGEVQIFNNRYGIAQAVQIGHLLELTEDMTDLSWNAAQERQFDGDVLGGSPEEDAAFLGLPSRLLKLRLYDQLDRQYETFVYRNFHFTLWKSNLSKLVSQPGESERDFRIRLGQAMRERRDLETERLRRKFATRVNRLENQLLNAQQRLEKEKADLQQKKMDMAVSVGSTILGAFLGGRRSRSGITRAARSATRMSKEKQDIVKAQEKLARVQEQIQALDEQFQRESELIAQKFDPMSETLQQVILRPKKSDILQKWYGIFWVPFLHRGDGTAEALSEVVGRESVAGNQ